MRESVTRARPSEANAMVLPHSVKAIDLTSLTEQEASIIQGVLQKDDLEMRILDIKISELRKEIQEIRKAGVLTAGDDQNSLCARCKSKLPPSILSWIGRRERCATCKFLICGRCCTKQTNRSVVCILCLKSRQEKLLTGEWLLKGQSTGLHGTQLLKTLLKDRRRVQPAYEETKLASYTQRPARSKDADSESRTSKNSQSSIEQTDYREKNCNSVPRQSITNQGLSYLGVFPERPDIVGIEGRKRTSISSLSSNPEKSPKYRSWNPSSEETSLLTVFRKKGEEYLLKRQKTLEDDKKDCTEISEIDVNNPKFTERRVSAYFNRSLIPHWHETLRRRSVVEAMTRESKRLKTASTPVLNVTPPDESICLLVNSRLTNKSILKDSFKRTRDSPFGSSLDSKSVSSKDVKAATKSHAMKNSKSIFLQISSDTSSSRDSISVAAPTTKTATRRHTSTQTQESFVGSTVYKSSTYLLPNKTGRASTIAVRPSSLHLNTNKHSTNNQCRSSIPSTKRHDPSGIIFPESQISDPKLQNLSTSQIQISFSSTPKHNDPSKSTQFYKIPDSSTSEFKIFTPFIPTPIDKSTLKLHQIYDSSTSKFQTFTPPASTPSDKSTSNFHKVADPSTSKLQQTPDLSISSLSHEENPSISKLEICNFCSPNLSDQSPFKFHQIDGSSNMKFVLASAQSGSRLEIAAPFSSTNSNTSTSKFHQIQETPKTDQLPNASISKQQHAQDTSTSKFHQIQDLSTSQFCQILDQPTSKFHHIADEIPEPRNAILQISPSRTPPSDPSSKFHQIYETSTSEFKKSPSSSPGPTAPQISKFQTSPSSSPGPTAPQVSKFQTSPSSSPGPTAPQISKFQTSPSSSPGPTAPQISKFQTLDIATLSRSIGSQDGVMKTQNPTQPKVLRSRSDVSNTSRRRQTLTRSGFADSLRRSWSHFGGFRDKGQLSSVEGIVNKERDNEGRNEDEKMSPGGGRQESYSRALEYQKVTVTVPKGNAGGGDQHRRQNASQHDSGEVEPFGQSLDVDSDLSSLGSSVNDSQRSSNDANSSGSCRNTNNINRRKLNRTYSIGQLARKTADLPAALPSRFLFRRSSSISQSEISEKSDNDNSWNQQSAGSSGEAKVRNDVSQFASQKSKPFGYDSGVDAGASSDQPTKVVRMLPKIKDTLKKSYHSRGKYIHRASSVEVSSIHRATSSEEDNFEDVYNSKINNLMQIMTGGEAVAGTGSAWNSSRGVKSELPLNCENGKGNEVFAQQSLSVCELGDYGVHSGCRGGSLEDDADSSSKNVVSNGVVVKETLLRPSELRNRKNPFEARTAIASSETRPPPSKIPFRRGLSLSTDKIQPKMLHRSFSCVKEETISETPQPEPDTNISTNVSQINFSETYSKPEVFIDSSALEEDLRLKDVQCNTNEDLQVAVKDNLTLNMFCSGSDVSDTMSIVTEVPEACGDAERFHLDLDQCSDDTIEDTRFEDSFSDDNEARTDIDISLILDKSIEDSEDEQSIENVDSSERSDSLSIRNDSRLYFGIRDIDREPADCFGHVNRGTDRTQSLSQGQEGTNPGGCFQEKASSSGNGMSYRNSEKSLYSSEDSPHRLKSGRKVEGDVFITGSPALSSLEATKTGEYNDSTRIDDVIGDEINRKVLDSYDDNCSISALIDSSGKAKPGGKPTLLSLARQFSESRDVYPLKNLNISDVSGSTVDLVAKDRVANRRPDVTNVKRGAGGQRRFRDDDADSGIISGHTTRTSTPEQRSQSLRPGSDHTSVPAISVSNMRGESLMEEDDSLDELFSNRLPNQLLGSRSSLADSRESIYSVYSDAGEVNYGRIPVTGEIMFNMSYIHKTSTLEVYVKQCRDLAPVDLKHNRSDPYVKTYLLPDKSRVSKRKTRIKKHTLNPVFDEVVKYQISSAELESRSLWLTVWHNDRFGRNDFLGEVTITLDYYRFDQNTPVWYQLQERALTQEPVMFYKGDLFIALKYIPADMVEKARKKKSGSFNIKSKDKKAPGDAAGELHVLVREAQNLTAMRTSAGSNPFCKGYILPDLPRSTKQKTPVIKKTTNPQWQHTLVFEGVDQSKLDDYGLELTIWDHEKLSSNDFLGGVRLNLGQGTYLGKPADWMDARGEEIEAWQNMIYHPNDWIDAQLPLRASMGKENVKK